jgi:hypothetical protein
MVGALVMPLSFRAAADDDRAYYTRQDVVQCQDTGAFAAAGAIAGGALGVIADIFGGGGRRDRHDRREFRDEHRDPAVPIIAGAAAGGIIGARLSCQDKQVYMQRFDQQLSSRDYNRPYEDDRLNFSVLKSGYDRSGNICRTYRVRYATESGREGYDSTACLLPRRLVNGNWAEAGWVHGFDDGAIADIRFHLDPVILVHTEPNYYYGREAYVGPAYRDRGYYGDRGEIVARERFGGEVDRERFDGEYRRDPVPPSVGVPRISR